MTDSREDKPRQFPCHTCAGTMVHGVTYTFPREYDPSQPSCGKVYTIMGLGASAVVGPTPPAVLVTCWRCKGAGWVAERRSFRRRNQYTRRFGDAPPSSYTPSAYELGRQEGLESAAMVCANVALNSEPDDFALDAANECQENIRALKSAVPEYTPTGRNAGLEDAAQWHVELAEKWQAENTVMAQWHRNAAMGLRALKAIDAEPECAPFDAALAYLRQDCQLDHNGDKASSVAPSKGWETGYCAGLRTAYRALKSAAPECAPSTNAAPQENKTDTPSVEGNQAPALKGRALSNEPAAAAPINDGNNSAAGEVEPPTPAPSEPGNAGLATSRSAPSPSPSEGPTPRADAACTATLKEHRQLGPQHVILVELARQLELECRILTDAANISLKRADDLQRENAQLRHDLARHMSIAAQEVSGRVEIEKSLAGWKKSCWIAEDEANQLRIAARSSTTPARIDLSLFVNGANIGGGDSPHIVLEKLQAALDKANVMAVSANTANG